MASNPPSYADITSTSGFVATVTISSSAAAGGKSSSDLLQGSGSLNFIVFMVIGFGATLGVIAVTLVVVIFSRRWWLRRRQRRQSDEEAAVVVPEPKTLYVVVHPGGTADVAHEEDESTPRRLVLKHKPIELNSALVAVDTIPAHRASPAKGAGPSQPHAPASPGPAAGTDVCQTPEAQLPGLRHSPSVSRYSNPVFAGEGAEEPEAPLPRLARPADLHLSTADSLEPEQPPAAGPGARLEQMYREQLLLSQLSAADSERSEDAGVLSQRFGRP